MNIGNANCEVRSVGAHTHGPNQTGCAAKEAVSRMVLSIGSNPTQDSFQLCRAEIGNLRPEVSTLLPSQVNSILILKICMHSELS